MKTDFLKHRAQKEAGKGFSNQAGKEFILNKDYKNNLLSKMM